MKAINAKYQEALDAFYKNPSWKMVYDAAPSDTAKEFIECVWDYSHWMWKNQKEMPEELERVHDADKEDIGKRMAKADWEFMASFAPHPKVREYYLKKAASAK